ncbi:ABC transporter ATP-binding protein YtrB [Paenibacillus plantiphilus]|uniref:ABC transporter ATP-binding protein YtrB n=1 Tax=Paenibacillus plantiphilus TaxID=2905650 RepID=A0ABN8GRK0_9BACL|nr:ABC transporter ATP-binding protein [Paenibacillus plantiphilus]CAH1212455.1 ABC transporter ATP-binding protein YtrB [Paenibacillus plantiphilus]
MTGQPNSADAVVVFEGVGKKFIGRTAVSNMSFTIPKGQIIGVIGINGSGKSTVLKLMAGLQKPSGGRVLVNGQTANRLSCRDVAFLPEQDVFYSAHTVRRTLDFYRVMFQDFNIAKALSIAESFELDLDQRIAKLSKGNRARLKIVLALSRQTPLVVMDEPLSGLDPLVRESIIKSLIANVDMERQTLVMSTHEVGEIEPLLDKVMLIHEGEVRGYEAVEDIQSEYGIGLVSWMRELSGERRRDGI